MATNKNSDTSEELAKAAPNSKFSQLGNTGLKVYSGYVNEEFHKKLQGQRGVETFQEMSENDSTVGAVLFAVDLLIRAVDWNVVPSDPNNPAAVDGKDFLDSVLHDMEHTFEDFVSEVMSMLPYGWSYFEEVLKRRTGPSSDPSKNSKHSDGKIGVRKLEIRGQDTLSRWNILPDGTIAGMYQTPAIVSEGFTGEMYIPMNRGLLFRTKVHKNNPEGRSILRSAYRSWYMLKTIQNVEAIGIERELAGLPVAYVPAYVMKSDAEAGDRQFYESVKKIVRDVKFNEQGGIVLPSDMWPGKDDEPSSAPMVKFELLTSNGRRQIDTNVTITRYQRDIARSVLADFIMLGTDGKGSYALSQDKTDLFLRACETFLWRVASVLNRDFVPRLWSYNGFPLDTMPTLEPGKVAPTDLAGLGDFIESLSRAGMPLFPDENLESYLRSEASLPDKGSEEI